MAEPHATFVPFTAQTRMRASICQRRRRHHPPHPQGRVGVHSPYIDQAGERIQKHGGSGDNIPARAHAVGRDGQQPGAGRGSFEDIVKGGIKERFGAASQNGVRTVMITGDNPLTAAAIAAEAGVDDFIAQAKRRQSWRASGGRTVRRQTVHCRMIGDARMTPRPGAGRRGRGHEHRHQAAREAGNMVTWTATHQAHRGVRSASNSDDAA